MSSQDLCAGRQVKVLRLLFSQCVRSGGGRSREKMTCREWCLLCSGKTEMRGVANESWLTHTFGRPVGYWYQLTLELLNHLSWLLCISSQGWIEWIPSEYLHQRRHLLSALKIKSLAWVCISVVECLSRCICRLNHQKDEGLKGVVSR